MLLKKLKNSKKQNNYLNKFSDPWDFMNQILGDSNLNNSIAYLIIVFRHAQSSIILFKHEGIACFQVHSCESGGPHNLVISIPKQSGMLDAASQSSHYPGANLQPRGNPSVLLRSVRALKIQTHTEALLRVPSALWKPLRFRRNSAWPSNYYGYKLRALGQLFDPAEALSEPWLLRHTQRRLSESPMPR